MFIPRRHRRETEMISYRDEKYGKTRHKQALWNHLSIIFSCFEFGDIPVSQT